MNVLVLTPCLYGTSPGQRFRWEQWAPHLRKEGIRLTFMAFESESLHEVLYQRGRHLRKAVLMLESLARRVGMLARVPDFDLVVVYREVAIIGPPLLEILLAHKGVPVVYDFDDPIWIPYSSPSNGIFARLKFTGKTRTICRLAERVTVGNRLLATWARRHSREVDVVPSTIDMTQYPVQLKNSGPVPTLGWTGSHSTLPFLQGVWDCLGRLAAWQRFRLVVVSHTESPALPPLPVEVICKRWQASTEANDLHEVDIGLAPFPDTGWTPWRCHGKVLQYMAAGIPTIASNVGIMPDYIHDGDNGFLVRSSQEWIDRLLLLIQHPSFRKRMGETARQTIEERFSAQVWVPRVKEILWAAAG